MKTNEQLLDEITAVMADTWLAACERRVIGTTPEGYVVIDLQQKVCLFASTSAEECRLFIHRAARPRRLAYARDRARCGCFYCRRRPPSRHAERLRFTMRGLALATLFPGISLIDPGPDFESRVAMTLARFVLFVVATIFILAGA
jgi:hypothetical protein